MKITNSKVLNYRSRCESCSLGRLSLGRFSCEDWLFGRLLLLLCALFESL